MKRVVGVQDPLSAGRGARHLDRGLDGLGPGVGRDHRADARGRTVEQLLGQHPLEQAHAELGHVRRAGRQHLFDGGDRLRVVAPDREHAVSADEVQIALAGLVDEVGPLPCAPGLVEADLRRIRPIWDKIAVVEIEILSAPAGEDLAHAG